MSSVELLEYMKCYTYEYRDPRKNNQAFYVGETGTENRWLYHLKEAKKFIRQNKSQKWIKENAENPHKTRTIMKILELGLEPKIVKVLVNVDKQTAVDEEIRRIAFHGRADKGLGPLTNMTDGGDGATGAKHTEEQNLAKSKRQKEFAKTPEGLKFYKDMGEKKKGQKRSKEICEKIAKKNRGQKRSGETRAKMKSSALLREPPSGEARKKNGDAHRGMKRPEGTGKKISDVLMGHKVSQTTKDKISLKLKVRNRRIKVLNCLNNLLIDKK